MHRLTDSRTPHSLCFQPAPMSPWPPSRGSPGVTPRQVNNWYRGRAAVPVRAGVIAVVLRDRSPEALTIDLEEACQRLAAP